MSERWFSPLLGWPGWAGTLGSREGGGGGTVPPVARVGAMCPTRCKVCWPVRCGDCWRGGCTASEGLCSFMLESTSFWFQVRYTSCCRDTLSYTFGMLDFCIPLPISLDSKDRQVLADLLPSFLMFGRNFVVCRVKFQQTAALSLLLR